MGGSTSLHRQCCSNCRQYGHTIRTCSGLCFRIISPPHKIQNVFGRSNFVSCVGGGCTNNKKVPKPIAVCVHDVSNELKTRTFLFRYSDDIKDEITKQTGVKDFILLRGEECDSAFIPTRYMWLKHDPTVWLHRGWVLFFFFFFFFFFISSHLSHMTVSV